MTTRATVTEAEMTRAIKAVQKCGLPVVECKMEKGAFRVITKAEAEVNVGNSKLRRFEDED